MTAIDVAGVGAAGRGAAGSAAVSMVVLVMTDVAGSTRLWAEYPAGMDAAMGRHHAIVHAAMAAHGGWRPVDQGEGDAVFAAFDSAGAAVAAVVDFQRMLADEVWPPGVDLRVRVGVHAGEVISRGGNLFGSTVNRCARLRGLGAGGQVLLSAPAFELVRDGLPDGVTVTDLGEHRMKDLTRPESVYQLVIPAQPACFPPLASLDRARQNLPVQTSSFLGRTREIADLVDLVGRERLLTVVGFGGMGKTRLALQVAAELVTDDRGGIENGVWFIDLSAVTDPGQVPTLIASALGTAEDGDGVLSGLLSGLKNKRLLLVLDNLEQLLPDAAMIVNQLVRAGPGVRVLSTSREPLRLSGEHEYLLTPLPVPPPPRAGPDLTDAELASLSTYDAVRLFLARAAAVRPELTLTAANAAAVAGICARLDGMPLALELAAARLRSMSPEALLPRLDHALTVLIGGNRDLPIRQRTLRATIDWSYDALTPDARQLLDRLSVFPGTFTFDAAEHICGPALTVDDNDLDVLDAIDMLVDQSILQHHDGTGGSDDRYSLLVSIRDYAAEHLRHRGDARTIDTRHAAYYTNLTARSDHRAGVSAWRAVVACEIHNVRAALITVHSSGTSHDELTLVGNVFEVLGVLDLHTECSAAITSALSRPASVSPELLVVLNGATFLEIDTTANSENAAAFAEREVAAARQLGEPSLLGIALGDLLMTTRSRQVVTTTINEVQTLLETLPASGTYRSAETVKRWIDRAVAGLCYADPDLAIRSWRKLIRTSDGVDRLYFQNGLLETLCRCGRFAEAEPIARLFEADESFPGTNATIRLAGAANAAGLRLTLGDVDSAVADLEAAAGDLEAADQQMMTVEVGLLRAGVLRARGEPGKAEQVLFRLLEDVTFDVDPIDVARIRLLLAVVHREQGSDRRAADMVVRAWSVAAGRQLRNLDLVLECLLERAMQISNFQPSEAVRLIGLVREHQGPFVFLDGINYDTEAMLGHLRDRLGDDEVQRLLDGTVGQPLPDDPVFDSRPEPSKAVWLPSSPH